MISSNFLLNNTENLCKTPNMSSLKIPTGMDLLILLPTANQ